MARHTNGPDWTDVALHLSAIGALHGCRVVLIVIADTQGHNGLLDLSLNARFEVLDELTEPTEVTVKGKWPNPDAASVAGRVLALAIELDWAISKKYKAGKLFENM